MAKRLLPLLLVLLLSVGLAIISFNAAPNSPIFRPAILASLALVAGAFLLLVLYKKARKPLIYTGKHYDLGLASFYMPYLLRFVMGLLVNGVFLFFAENIGERIVTAIVFCMQIPLAVLMFRGHKAFPAAYIAASSITISMYFAFVSSIPAALFLLIDPSLIMRLLTSPIASARYSMQPVYLRMPDGSLAAFGDESYRAFVKGSAPDPAAAPVTKMPSAQASTAAETSLPPG